MDTDKAEFMAGFDPEMYFQDPKTLTDNQRLQVEVARIIYTSIDGAISEMSTTSDPALWEVLKLEKRKSLIMMIEREIRKRNKAPRCRCCDPIHPGDDPRLSDPQ